MRSSADWLDLLRTIHPVTDTGRADGVVISHGTNTLEETAYFLTSPEDRVPVVLVGAMRPALGLGADGYLTWSTPCESRPPRIVGSRPTGGVQRHDLRRS